MGLFGPDESEMTGDALFSECGLYRYWLSRTWDPQKDGIVFTMLNPSTADAKVLDPTIRRCVRFARDWGYGELMVLNIFAFRSPYPKDLTKTADPVGPENDHFIELMSNRVRRFTGFVVAWGKLPTWAQPRARKVMELIGRPVDCLGTNADGSPRHPLYIPANFKPVRFTMPKE